MVSRDENNNVHKWKGTKYSEVTIEGTLASFPEGECCSVSLHQHLDKFSDGLKKSDISNINLIV